MSYRHGHDIRCKRAEIEITGLLKSNFTKCKKDPIPRFKLKRKKNKLYTKSPETYPNTT